MRRYTVIGAMILTVIAGFGIGTTYVPASASAQPVAHHSVRLPKCKTEDSDNCIWNAHTSGNGKGVSFIAYHGKVYYLDECAGEAIPNPCDPDSNN